MKIQDIIFLLSLAIGFPFRQTRYFLWMGMGCLVLAIPLFAKWIFFTAERLTWYAAAFFFLFIVGSLRLHSTVE